MTDVTEKSPLSRLAQAIASPWRAAQLLTAAKSFEANPFIGSERLNRRGLHAARVSLAHAMAARRRRRLAHLVSPEDRAAYARDGFVMRPDFLPPDRFTRLVSELRAWRGDALEAMQGDTRHRKMALDPQALAAVPTLRAVIASPAWRGLIRYVGSLDSDPQVLLQTLVRPGGETSSDPQTRLHADTFHPTAKAWLFLTDVAEDAGPFSYAPGSHQLTPARLDWERRMSFTARAASDSDTREGSFRVAPAELAAMGFGPARLFPVKANTLLVADTFGFHARGPSLRPSMRVEIFALGRRDPFRPWPGLDPLTTPMLGAASRASWRLAAALRRGRKSKLRHAVSPFDPA